MFAKSDERESARACSADRKWCTTTQANKALRQLRQQIVNSMFQQQSAADPEAPRHARYRPRHLAVLGPQLLRLNIEFVVDTRACCRNSCL